MEYYHMVGGKLRKRGIIICSLFIIIVVYLSNRLDWSIAVTYIFEVDIMTTFRAIPDLIGTEVIESSVYLRYLAMVYGFIIRCRFNYL